MNKWSNKVALVTGASAGIGKAVVSRLVKNEMNVVACARNLAKLEEIASELNVSSNKGKMFPVKCDLKQEDDILSMFKFIKEKFGALHVCINNAGLAWNAPLLTGKTEEWKEMIDVNVIALCMVTRESYTLMKEAGIDDGVIINLNSMSGHRLAGLPMYSATKFAVTALTEGLRKELRALNSHIRTASISPGMVETEFAERLLKGDTVKAKERYSQLKCLQAEDIVDAVIFVLSSPPHMDVNEIYIRPTEQVS